jgi:hypothetical protein
MTPGHPPPTLRRGKGGIAFSSNKHIYVGSARMPGIFRVVLFSRKKRTDTDFGHDTDFGQKASLSQTSLLFSAIAAEIAYSEFPPFVRYKEY